MVRPHRQSVMEVASVTATTSIHHPALSRQILTVTCSQQVLKSKQTCPDWKNMKRMSGFGFTCRNDPYNRALLVVSGPWPSLLIDFLLGSCWCASDSWEQQTKYYAKGITETVERLSCSCYLLATKASENSLSSLRHPVILKIHVPPSNHSHSC